MTSLQKLFGQFGRKTPAAPDLPAIGSVEQMSVHHVAGWAESAAGPGTRAIVTVRRRDTGTVIAQDKADHFRFGLTQLGARDEGGGYYIRFATPLSEDVLTQIEVAADETVLPRAPYFSTSYQPLMLLAGDIVNNCNLRCPFCLYDYSDTRATYLMDEATIDAALRFLPHIAEGRFWFSCRHEPALHPDLMKYVDKVPRALRKQVFYTTNLAKRMPNEYFAWLADAGLHEVNVSIESRVPAVYEKMRKGARFAVFQENWDRLIAAMEAHPDPTPVRYIAMVYRSNFRELPELVDYLLTHRRAFAVELRYTFDYPYIPSAFRETEFLDEEGWFWLRDRLAAYPANQVLLILPPQLAPPTPPLAIEWPDRPTASGRADDIRHYLPGRYEARMSWDGTFEIRRYWAHPYERPPMKEPLLVVNVRDIDEPLSFFRDLPI